VPLGVASPARNRARGRYGGKVHSLIQSRVRYVPVAPGRGRLTISEMCWSVPFDPLAIAIWPTAGWQFPKSLGRLALETSAAFSACLQALDSARRRQSVALNEWRIARSSSPGPGPACRPRNLWLDSNINDTFPPAHSAKNQCSLRKAELPQDYIWPTKYGLSANRSWPGVSTQPR